MKRQMNGNATEGLICCWREASRKDVFFFFQAEDGIRDDLVTGVQTCALPIFPGWHHMHDLVRLYAAELGRAASAEVDADPAVARLLDHYLHTAHRAALLLSPFREPLALPPEIGRASCRERR